MLKKTLGQLVYGRDMILYERHIAKMGLNKTTKTRIVAKNNRNKMPSAYHMSTKLVTRYCSKKEQKSNMNNLIVVQK
jgi:hypothetical protein